MGDRGVVVIKDRACYSSGIYVHYHGSALASMLEDAISSMRKDDAQYSAARLCGEFHNNIDGNTGLGILRPPTKDEVEDGFRGYSHGDAGVVVYDCSTGEVSCYGGYLERDYPNPIQMAVPPSLI